MLEVHMPCGPRSCLGVLLTEIGGNSRVAWQQLDMLCPRKEVVIQLSSKRRKKRGIGTSSFFGWYLLVACLAGTVWPWEGCRFDREVHCTNNGVPFSCTKELKTDRQSALPWQPVSQEYCKQSSVLHTLYCPRQFLQATASVVAIAPGLAPLRERIYAAGAHKKPSERDKRCSLYHLGGATAEHIVLQHCSISEEHQNMAEI